MANLVFRVYDDPDDHDLANGDLYNEDFEQITLNDVASMGATVAINPVTTDQFDLLRTAHAAEAPILMEFQDLTDAEREDIGLE